MAITSQFRLLDLPSELWVRICRLAVESESAFNVSCAISRRWAQQILRQPAILRTCKIVRREVLPHFYASNTFLFQEAPWPSPIHITAWITAIGSANYSMIRHCEVYAKTYMWHEMSYMEASYKLWRTLSDESGFNSTSLRTTKRMLSSGHCTILGKG